MIKKIYTKLKTLPTIPKEFGAWLWICVGCNIFALSNVVVVGVYNSFIRQWGYNWAKALLSQLIIWNVWVLLITPIINFVRSHPYNSKRPVYSLIQYFVGGIKYSFIHNFFFALLYTIANIGVEGIPFTIDTLIDFIITSFLVSFVAYIAIIAFIQAFSYYENYQKSLLHSSQLETQLVQAQLDALKFQLQPHFIFNALNSISALQLRDIRASQKMIANLGKFLRLTLKDTNAQEILLKEEIELVKCYLDIEQVRFQDRLTINFDIEEESLYAKVPNLILQPIVENAIKHGISQTTCLSYIKIRAKKKDDILVLEVEDNGVGIDNIEELWQKSKLGLGLTNTKARLEHLYGSKQKLELNKRLEGGLIVALLIPFQYFSENILEVISIDYKED